MAKQWTVSFELSDVESRARKVLESGVYEFEMYGSRVDMSEEEFFGLLEDVESQGLKLPVDGSASWGKFI